MKWYIEFSKFFMFSSMVLIGEFLIFFLLFTVFGKQADFSKYGDELGIMAFTLHLIFSAAFYAIWKGRRTSVELSKEMSELRIKMAVYESRFNNINEELGLFDTENISLDTQSDK
jgi:hypothetical protein